MASSTQIESPMLELSNSEKVHLVSIEAGEMEDSPPLPLLSRMLEVVTQTQTRRELQFFTDLHSKVLRLWSKPFFSYVSSPNCFIFLNGLSARRLMSQNSVNDQHIETLSSRHHNIETVSVSRTRIYKKHPNLFLCNNLMDVQQMKNVYNTEKQIIKLGLLNIRSLSTKASFVNDMITDHKLDVLSLTESWLKPDEYIILNESIP